MCSTLLCLLVLKFLLCNSQCSFFFNVDKTILTSPSFVYFMFISHADFLNFSLQLFLCLCVAWIFGGVLVGSFGLGFFYGHGILGTNVNW